MLCYSRCRLDRSIVTSVGIGTADVMARRQCGFPNEAETIV